MQWRLTNLFVFQDWCDEVWPTYSEAVQRLRESASAGQDIKDWTKNYDNLAHELIRLRKSMFENRHAKTSIDVNYAIDRCSPTLAKCPIDVQKAINFATHGADCTICGLHQARYFHEATQLNPLVGLAGRIPSDELKKLCDSLEVSYCNANPPHPYQLDPLGPTKKKFGPPRRLETTVPIDREKPKWPDIPDELQQPDDKIPSAPQQGSPLPV